MPDGSGSGGGGDGTGDPDLPALTTLEPAGLCATVPDSVIEDIEAPDTDGAVSVASAVLDSLG